jgi:tellurite resistance protein TerC
MTPSLHLPALAARSGALDTIGTPALWTLVIGAVAVLIAVDFLLTRRPHEVSMKEALAWSAFYVALPLAFGGYLLAAFGSERGVEYLTGYLVEKSLSVDNLFVFMLLLGAFAVPRELQQRVLLYGIVGALVLRSVFIALGAAALSSFDWMFLVFGLVLIVTAVKILRDALTGHGADIEVDRMRSVRLVRRLFPVTTTYDGPRLLSRVGSRRALTPLALVVVAVFATDIVFAVDSVPAV